MPKTILKLLIAGTTGFLSIIGGDVVRAAFSDRLPVGRSNTGLVVTILAPMAVRLLVACPYPGSLSA